jgi:hypothetical protein
MGFKSRCEMCACVIIHNKIIESGRIHPLWWSSYDCQHPLAIVNHSVCIMF